MRTKRYGLWILTALVLFAIVIAGCGGDVEQEKKPSKTAEEPVKVTKTGLEGKWEGGLGDVASQGWTFEVTGNKLEIGVPKQNVFYKGTLKINSNADPKTMDFKISECSEKKYVGTTALAIYKFEGDNLVYASSEPGSAKRPSSFEAGKEKGMMVFILTRK